MSRGRGRGRGRVWNLNQEPWGPGGPGLGANYIYPCPYGYNYKGQGHIYRGGYGYPQTRPMYFGAPPPPPGTAPSNDARHPPLPHQHPNSHYNHYNAFSNGHNGSGHQGTGGYNQRRKSKSRSNTPSSGSKKLSVKKLGLDISKEPPPPGESPSDFNSQKSMNQDQLSSKDGNDKTPNSKKKLKFEKSNKKPRNDQSKEDSPKIGKITVEVKDKDASICQETDTEPNAKEACSEESRTKKFNFSESLVEKENVKLKSSKKFDDKIDRMSRLELSFTSALKESKIHDEGNNNKNSGNENQGVKGGSERKIPLNLLSTHTFSGIKNGALCYSPKVTPDSTLKDSQPSLTAASEPEPKIKEAAKVESNDVMMVKEELLDSSYLEGNEIDYENVEIDCDPGSLMIAESEDDEASELPQPVMSPEPRVDSTSSCQPPDTGTTNPSPGVSNMDQDATVPFGLGIEEMQLAGMLGQSGSKKGGGAQAKSFKFYSQKVKELKEIGKKRAAKTIELEKLNKEMGVLLKLHRKKTAEMKALQREEKMILNA